MRRLSASCRFVVEIAFGDGRVVDAGAANGHQPVFHVPGQRLAGDGKAAGGQLHRARFEVAARFVCVVGDVIAMDGEGGLVGQASAFQHAQAAVVAIGVDLTGVVGAARFDNNNSGINALASCLKATCIWRNSRFRADSAVAYKYRKSTDFNFDVLLTLLLSSILQIRGSTRRHTPNLSPPRQ